MKLSENEIKKRLINLRNLEHLYEKARERITFLVKENKKLKQKIKGLEENDKDKGEKIEAITFQLEQIKNKLFGKKPVKRGWFRKSEKKNRDTLSYTRSIPRKVTATRHHGVTTCSCCKEKLQNKSTKIFFEEDIPLPIQKTAIKHEVEVGYCKSCMKQTSGIPIPPKKAILGENVRKYVCILSIVSRLSHSQIQNHLQDVFNFQVSIGEIGNILTKEANNLRPEYEQQKQAIMGEGIAHYDETGWKVAKEEHGKYGWVMVSAKSNNTIFMLGKSRGKGNLDDLGITTVGITDDYGVYKNAFEDHQLCFAHPHRKLRDLAESRELKEKARVHCENVFRSFGALYHHIEKRRDKPSVYLKQKWHRMFDEITKPHIRDPVALQKIKTSLRKNKQKYFTFLKYPGLPIDNNKAERALRHLVIKRKISFGSKTQRGAETTSILASIILSLRWNDPDNWFQKYLQLST